MTLPLAGAKVRASDLSTIFPQNTDAWTAYTPTWTQGATISKTITRASYTKIGRTVTGLVYMTATSSGTAANPVKVTVPTAAASATGAVGTFWMYDVSAATYYTGIVTWADVNTLQFIAGGATTNVLGQATFTAALVSGDLFACGFTYEAAS